MKFFYLLAFAFGLLVSPYSYAQDAQDANDAYVQSDLLPSKSLRETDIINANDFSDEPIRLTPDKSEVLHLEDNAATVIVGNPAHLNVLAENSKTLVLVPLQAGATHFYVLNKAGKMILARHVIVASPKEQYIRIRNTCKGVDGCEDTQVYYCPGMCHNIANPSSASEGNDPEAPASTSSAPNSQAGSSGGEAAAAGTISTQETDARY